MRTMRSMSFLERANEIRERSLVAGAKQKPTNGSSALQRSSSLSEPVYQERTLLDGVLYYLGVLLKYRWLIIAITALSAIGVVAFSIVSLRLPPSESPLPNRYESSAVLLMNTSGSTSSTQALLTALGVDVDRGPVDYGETAVLVLGSRTTVDTLIEEFDLTAHYPSDADVKIKTRARVWANTHLSYNSKTGSLRISYEDIDPVLAKDIVARMIELLSEWFAVQGGSTRTRQKQLLEIKLENVESEIARLQAEIQDIQEQHRVLTIEELAAAQSSLLNELRTQRAMKEMEISNYREFSRIDDPKMAQMRVELSNLTELIRQVENGEYSSMPAQDEIPDLAARFSRLNTELGLQQRLYETLSEQYEVAKLTDVDETIFEVLEHPEVPVRKSGPSRGELCMMVTIGGFIAAVALAFLLNAVGSVRNDPEKLKMLNHHQ